MPRRPRPDDRGDAKLSFKRMGILLLLLILFPIYPLLLSTVFGGLLALAESAAYIDGFLYVASNLLGMSTPLTDFNPNNAGDVVIDVYVSIMALLSFGVMLNFVNLFQVPLAINQEIERWIPLNKILVPMIALVFVIPSWIAFHAVVFGSILGAVEGWPMHDGIFYVISDLLGLGTSLTQVIPATVWGDLLDILISSMALGFVAIFVDYVTVLNPARYLRKRFREALIQRGVLQLNSMTSLHPLACDEASSIEGDDHSNADVASEAA